MLPVSERMHMKRLKSKNIVIEDRFYNKTRDGVLVRSSNLSRCDNIIDCPRKEKEYFHNNKSIYIEKDFDMDVKYTFLMSTNSDDDLQCPSCGYKGKAKEFSSGCPYCQSEFSIDFSLKKRSRWEDRKKNVFLEMVIWLIFFAFFACMTALYEYKEIVDKVLPVVNFLLIVFAVGYLLYVFIFLFKAAITPELWKEFKERKMKINEQRVFNDLNIGLNNYYYDNSNSKYKDLIDFDIISYERAQYDLNGGNTYMILTYIIRKYYLVGEKIKTTICSNVVKLVRNKKVRHISDDTYVVKCDNCGSPMNFYAEECEYCRTKNESVNGWIIDSFILDE